MAMTERDLALEPFDVLIGTWDTEATHPLFDGVVPGRTSFEWLEGGRFVVQRSDNDHESFPDAISVIGAPEAGDGLVMEYFNSRGVRRTYGVSLDDRALHVWRDDPTFAQRFSATIGTDSFEGRWQLARTPGDWKGDLEVVYHRRMPRDVVNQTRRFWEEAFNGRDLSLLDDLIAEDYVNDAALPGTPPGPAGQAAVLQRLWAALPEARFEITHLALDGDVVICIGTMSGTHDGELLDVPASGRRVEWRMCHLMRFDADGRAVEHRAIRDDLGLMRQMGAP